MCTEKTDTSQAGLLPPEGWLQEEEEKEGRNKNNFSPIMTSAGELVRAQWAQLNAELPPCGLAA